MGFKDLYYSLEESFNKSIDAIDAKIPVRGFFNAIDKVIPSFIFVNLILLLLIIGIALLLFLPNNQEVNFIFKAKNSQLVESFDFSLSVDGKGYNARVENGTAKIILKKGSKISIDSISTNEFVIAQKLYDFSNSITVKLDYASVLTPVSIYLFNPDGSTLNKEANLSFACSNAKIADSESEKKASGNVIVNVPSNCGTLNISGQLDGYILTSGNQCDSTACSLEFSPISNSNINLQSYPNGSIKVIVLNEIGEPVLGAKVKIYDSSDLRDELDLSLTNAFGSSKTFTNLPVGSYNVYVSDLNAQDHSEDVVVNENQITEVKVTLNRQSLGKINLNFVDIENNSVSGTLVLKDSLGKIVYRNETSGKLEMPVYNYGKFYLDFKPDDTNLYPVLNYIFDIDTTKSSETILVKKTSTYNFAKINIQVVDEDNKPVENAKIFIKDAVTQFDLLLYVDNTDENGQTSVLLTEGPYIFRAYNGFSEAFSESITVATNVSGDVPQIDVKIQMSFGYTLLTLKVLDEFSQAKANSQVTFYKKPKVDLGAKLTDVSGTVSNSFKAGNYLYYTVKEDNYLPYFSEARLLLNNYIWDENVKLIPIQENKEPRVEFLGVFDSIAQNETKSMDIGNSYYLGFRIFVYNDPEDEMVFKIKTGDMDIVEKDKLYLIDAFTSANYDARYSDNDENNLTLAETKVIESKWNNPKAGVYNVYYKVNVRNNSSVKLYDPLTVNWSLLIDEKEKTKETRDFLAGTKSVCAQNKVCGRYTLLDKTNDLYLDAIDNSFLINSGNEYELNFDLINGIDGTNGEIKNGHLEIYNALSDSESLSTVKNDISSRSFLRLNNYNLNGPENYKDSFSGTKFGSFVENYKFQNLIKNRYISGNLNFSSILADKSYMNFVLVDEDKKVIVEGKPSLSLLFDSESIKNLKIITFPDRVLAPNSNQELKVIIKDDLNNNVTDALVSLRIKKPLDNKYSVLNYCNNKTTNEFGEINCLLQEKDMLPGTYIQIIAEKEGYSGYSKKDFKPDLEVTTKMFDFDKDKLLVDLIYPIQSEGYDALAVINNTAKTISIDHLELNVDNYSQDAENYLNIVEMKKYIENVYLGKEILGRQLNYDADNILDGEAKTNLEKVFKAALNESLTKEIDKSVKVSGAVTIYFKTDNESFSRVIPYVVNISSEGYPTNAEDCLKIALADNKTGYASDSGKLVKIPLTLVNNCGISTQNSQVVNVNSPIIFDNAFAVLNHDSGSLGLGNFNFNFSDGSTDLRFSVPKEFKSNWEARTDDQIYSGEINFNPSSGRLGKESLKFKIFGLVKTSNGYKRVESNEISFDVSVLNIEDCIKILYNSEEIDQLKLVPKEYTIDTTSLAPTSDATKFNISIKNVCEGLPLDIKLCSDNENKISKSCGEEFYYDKIGSTEYTGFLFDDLGNARQKEIKSLNGEQKIDIKRPLVSGAYALEIFARQDSQEMGYKKIKSIPINVQTSYPNNYLFTDMPFLMVNNEATNYSSDVMKVYNLDIPGNLKITDKETFIKLLESKEKIQIGDYSDLLDFTSTSDWTGQDSYGGGQLYNTIGGAIAGAVGVTLITLVTAAATSAAALAAVPLAGWIASAVIALAIAAAELATASISHINDSQDSKYLLIKDIKQDIAKIGEDSISIGKEGTDKSNYATLFAFSGQDHYSYKIVYESVDAGVGMTSKTWTDRLNFDVSCDGDYEVDPENIMYLTSGDDAPKTTFEDCGWQDTAYTISTNKKTVTFKPKCGGEAYSDPTLRTFVVVGCKLKPEYWSRASLGGISDGYSDVGIFNLQFTNLNLSQCNTEWCYKTYNINVFGGLLGKENSAIRVAFKNPNRVKETVNQIGSQCTNLQGTILGFTGEKAKPKVSYVWDDSIDSKFCTLNDKNEIDQYCDATQFMISNLQRMKTATDLFANMVPAKCPYKQPFNKLKTNVEFESDIFESKLEADQNTKKIVLTVTKKEYLDSSKTLNEKMYLQIGNNNPIDMNALQSKNEVIQNGIAVNKYETLFFTPIIDIPDVEKTELGETKLYSKSGYLLYYLCDSSNANCVLNKTMPIALDINAKKYPGGCIIEQPSTYVSESDGRMILFNFYDQNKIKDDESLRNKLYEMQDLLHYKAYLMNDGYTKDFLNDFYNYYTNKSFLNNISPYLDELNISEKIDNGTFKIVNKLNEPNANGPGEYGVHVNIIYSKGNYTLQDANIVIVLEKLNSAVNDSIFYYMPIDGLVGIDNDVVDRQGYGIEFTGDQIAVDNSQLNETLFTNLQSNSNANAKVIVNNNSTFSQMNNSDRGVLFNATRNLSNNIELTFLPDFVYYKPIKALKNNVLEQDVTFDYSLKYNSELELNDSIILPWFAYGIDNNIDFTGQSLFETYPRYSSVTEDPSVARLSYNSDSVTNLERYFIYSIIYVKKNSSLELETKSSLNLNNTSFSNLNENNLNINTLQDVIQGINDNKLCISKSASDNTTKVFVNEKEIMQ